MFPAGTGIAHTFLNNTSETCLILVEGEMTKPENKIFYPLHPGIKYMLKKDGEVVEQGTLKSRFRVVSIFWPPVALAYWPMGFNSATYDFTTPNSLVRPDPNFAPQSKVVPAKAKGKK